MKYAIQEYLDLGWRLIPLNKETLKPIISSSGRKAGIQQMHGDNFAIGLDTGYYIVGVDPIHPDEEKALLNSAETTPSIRFKNKTIYLYKVDKPVRSGYFKSKLIYGRDSHVVLPPLDDVGWITSPFSAEVAPLPFSLTEERDEPLAESQPVAAPVVKEEGDKKDDEEEEEPFMPFPQKCLPELFNSYAIEISKSVKVDVSVPSSIMLAFMASCFQRKYKVVVSPSTGYSEPLNLFIVGILESGERKSSALRYCMEGLKQVNREAEKNHKTLVANDKAYLNFLKSKMQQVSKQLVAGKNLTESKVLELETQQKELYLEVEHFKIRYPRPYLLDDCTNEKLVDLLRQHQESLSFFSSEGGLFNVIKGMYSKNNLVNFDIWLKGYDGDAYTRSRMSDGQHFTLNNPHLTAFLAVQKTVIRGVIGNENLKETGFVSRWLYFNPPSQIGSRMSSDEYVLNQELRERFIEVTKSMASKEFPEEYNPVEITLSPEAYDIYKQASDRTEELMRPGTKYSDMRDWASKHPCRLVRIAANLHLATHGEFGGMEISGQVMEKAFSLFRYYAQHAHKIFGKIASEPVEQEHARLIKELAIAQGWTRFTARDVIRHKQYKIPDNKTFDIAIQELIDSGHVIRQRGERKGKGRPPADYFLLT